MIVSDGDHKRKVSDKTLPNSGQSGPAGGGKPVDVPEKCAPTGQQSGEELGPAVSALAGQGVPPAPPHCRLGRAGGQEENNSESLVSPLQLLHQHHQPPSLAWKVSSQVPARVHFIAKLTQMSPHASLLSLIWDVITPRPPRLPSQVITTSIPLMTCLGIV